MVFYFRSNTLFYGLANATDLEGDLTFKCSKHKYTMKNIISTLLLISFTCISLIAQVSLTAASALPKYIPSDQDLHNAIVELDKKFFNAYNTCDISVHEELISEDLEFYHDLGGLATSKAQILQALKDNICNKVKRELIEGTIEVYPIPGYGAIQMGWHQFLNSEEPNAESRPSKFVTIWKQDGNLWQITRVISLH